ncbi:MAG TPA: peptidylprolyl isomerase [Gemmatimonadaceae bacterium]
MTQRLTAVIAAAALLAGDACVHGAGTVATPAQRRAILLDPRSSFWEAHAPRAFDARVETSKGAFVLEIERDWAPRGADRFYNLARAGFYDDSRFSRVVPRFIAQFGIPGDPAVGVVWRSRAFTDDPVTHSNVRGTIAFAMTGPNTRTTQLYISLVDNTRLDAQGFAPIGRVIEGMAVVDSLYSGYGEKSGGGVRAGNQTPLFSGGNAYVDREYPKLDRLIRITVTDRK